jgi:hypothetical protein
MSYHKMIAVSVSRETDVLIKTLEPQKLKVECSVMFAMFFLSFTQCL